MALPTIGLEDYARLIGDGALIRNLKRLSAATSHDYQRFVQYLYEEIKHIFELLQTNPQRRLKDWEDRITDEVVSNLNTAGYQATHDQSSGGHVDVTVTSMGLTWIGEAKKYSSVTNVFEGFQQLSTRYRPASGNFEHNHGGLLIYITDKPDAKKLMTDWKNHLGDKSIGGYESRECTENYLSFISEHTHDVTGMPFIVRHIPLLLHQDPKDKSGRSRKSSKPRSVAGLKSS